MEGRISEIYGGIDFLKVLCNYGDDKRIWLKKRNLFGGKLGERGSKRLTRITGVADTIFIKVSI